MKQIVCATLLLSVIEMGTKPLNNMPETQAVPTTFQLSSVMPASIASEYGQSGVNTIQSVQNGSINSSNAVNVAGFRLAKPTIDSPRTDTGAVVPDTGMFVNDSSISIDDSLLFDFGQGFVPKHRRTHVFRNTGIESSRQIPYTENFSLIDFNRATGFFLGLGSPGLVDIGPHDELGLGGGFGYGFASKRWEYRMDGEIRLPLTNVKKLENDTSENHPLHSPPTIAVGGGFHNITSTDDAWRTDRLENAVEAFLAREDFRDYYKLAGWSAFIAFRPRRNSELRIEWRSDYYSSLSQTVFWGRWGGNKELPPNPAIDNGEMHSLVTTFQHERVHTRTRTVPNIWGDSVDIEQLAGCSSLVQAELGHMPGSDFGFNRYLLDSRQFEPILNGLSIDTRLRFEATTGDMLPQKLEYLGGPSSLPGLYDKSLVGNRLLLLNTEVRFNLAMLSAGLHTPDINLIIYNDFGKIGIAGDGGSILQGFGFTGVSSIVYNIGAGIGWTNGLQIGASWRTDIKADPRWMVRFQRPF